MTSRPHRPVAQLLGEARRALLMSQGEFGRALGASQRSASRWDTGRATPSANQLRQLAVLLFPESRELAEETASYIGETLETLGLEARPEPTGPAANYLAEIVVCAAAEAADASPRAIRRLLYVAFRRAREIGLTTEAVETALAGEAEQTRKAGENGPGKRARED